MLSFRSCRWPLLTFPFLKIRREKTGGRGSGIPMSRHSLGPRDYHDPPQIQGGAEVWRWGAKVGGIPIVISPCFSGGGGCRGIPVAWRQGDSSAVGIPRPLPPGLAGPLRFCWRRKNRRTRWLLRTLHDIRHLATFFDNLSRFPRQIFLAVLSGRPLLDITGSFFQCLHPFSLQGIWKFAFADERPKHVLLLHHLHDSCQIAQRFAFPHDVIRSQIQNHTSWSFKLNCVVMMGKVSSVWFAPTRCPH